MITRENILDMGPEQAGQWDGVVDCPVCHGTGRERVDEPMPLSPSEVLCIRCLGKGKLRRVVEINVIDTPVTGEEG